MSPQPVFPRFNVRSDFFSQILDPFGMIDFASVYSRHNQIVDFILFSILFIGISRVTLTKHFNGAGGKLLSVGTGIVLSLALVIMQDQMGFSLLTFAPFAVFLLCILMILMLFVVLNSFGMQTKISLSISYIAIYTCLRAFVPSFFDWLTWNVSFVAGIMTIALIISIGIILFAIMPKSNQSTSFGDQAMKIAPELFPKMQEASNLIDSSNNLSNQIDISERDVFKRLKQIRKFLPTLMQTEGGQAELLQAIREIKLENNEIVSKLSKMSEINKAIESEDVQVFQKLFGMMNKVPNNQMSKAVKALKGAKQRLNLESVIASLEKRIDEITNKFSKLIDILFNAVQNRDINTAKRAIDAAIQMEKTLQRIIKPLEAIESSLKASYNRAIRMTTPKKR